jgi:hypothetical protein
VAIYTSAKALSRWPINDESTLTVLLYDIPSIGGFVVVAQMMQAYGTC